MLRIPQGKQEYIEYFEDDNLILTQKMSKMERFAKVSKRCHTTNFIEAIKIHQQPIHALYINIRIVRKSG